jgi:hypothetical protein
MVYTSADGLLEVSVSEVHADGYFTVSAKQLTPRQNSGAHQNGLWREREFTTLVYRSGDQTKGMFAPIKGDHPGDVVRDVKITVESVPPY